MMRLLAGILVVLLAACGTTESTTFATVGEQLTPAPTATPYEYPDLPGGIETKIAEGDCEDLDTLAKFMDRDAVDPIVRHQALDAIAYRSEELGC